MPGQNGRNQLQLATRLFLLSQLKVLSDFLDYIKLDARSNRTQPNLARNSLFSFRGSLLFPK